MRLPAAYVDASEFLERIGTSGLVVRGTLVLSVAVSSLTASALGGYSTWFLAGLVLLGCVAAVVPDSSAPLVVIAAMGAQWVIVVRPVSVVWSVVPALCVLVVHAAAARAASLPDHAPYDAVLMRRWLRQTGVVGLATIVIWTVVVTLDADPAPAGVGVTALAFVGAVVVTAVLAWRLDS